MTDKDAIKLATEKLEAFLTGDLSAIEAAKTIDTLRARLADGERQEPVGYFVLTPEISVPPGGQPFQRMWIQVAEGCEDEGAPLYRQPPTAAPIRAEAMEECAAEAERQAEDEPYGHAKFRCSNIAAAIRKLAQEGE